MADGLSCVAGVTEQGAALAPQLNHCNQTGQIMRGELLTQRTPAVSSANANRAAPSAQPEYLSHQRGCVYGRQQAFCVKYLGGLQRSSSAGKFLRRGFAHEKLSRCEIQPRPPQHTIALEQTE